jgi:hypothetical protein
MEPKFVSLDQVVKEYIGKQTVNPTIGLFNNLPLVFPELTPDAFFEPIITEDIDCEIVEPKQLPAPEDPKRD